MERGQMEKLLGHSLPPQLYNALRSRPSLERKRTEIHELVERAVSRWALPKTARDAIADNVTLKIVKEIRQGLEPEIRPLIACLLHEEAARRGRSIREVNRALAAIGAHTREASHWLVLAASSMPFKILVSGAERSGKTCEVDRTQWKSWLEMHGYSEDARIVRALVPLYMSDVGMTEIRVVGAIILEYSKKRRATLVSPSTLRIWVDLARSFYAFRSMKKVRLDGNSSAPHPELDRISYAKKFMLGNGLFPLSTELATVAGCLRRLNATFLGVFKEKRNDEGRSWKSVAIDALSEADQQVFTTISRVKRGEVIMAVGRMTNKLKKNDLHHTGTKGILVLSEFEVVEQ